MDYAGGPAQAAASERLIWRIGPVSRGCRQKASVAGPVGTM